MSFINKIMCLAVVFTAIGGMVLAWQNHAAAPEISLFVLGGLCILALAGTIFALSLAARARQETAKLSLLFENAFDRLEHRHDSDHARLVMTIAALDARSSHREATGSLTKESSIINGIRPSQQSSLLKISDFPQQVKRAALLESAFDERPLADAVELKKLSLSLEPIFKMPSADVQGYLAFAHVGEHDIRRLAAKSTVNRRAFEYQLLFAAAKAARQLLANVPRQSQIFCSIGQASLREPKSLDAIIDLFEAQPVLKETLILLVSCNDLQDVDVNAFGRLQRAGIHLAIEGLPERVDVLRHFQGGYWFVSAADVTALPTAEYAQNYRHNAEIHKLTLVALEGGDEAELVELIDLNLALVTSRYLSPPRAVRDS